MALVFPAPTDKLTPNGAMAKSTESPAMLPDRAPSLCPRCGELCHIGLVLCKECEKKRTHHPQRETKQGILVDEQLVGMLELLWDSGYTTYNSCQDSYGSIWFEFDLESYNTLSAVMQHNTQLAEYIATAADIECREDYDDSGKTFMERLVLVSLRFPNDDLQWFEMQLQSILL